MPDQLETMVIRDANPTEGDIQKFGSNSAAILKIVNDLDQDISVEIRTTTFEDSGVLKPVSYKTETVLLGTVGYISIIGAWSFAQAIVTAAGVPTTGEAVLAWDFKPNPVDPDVLTESDKGVADGVCPLDGTVKIPLIYIPASVLDHMDYKGPWDASGGTMPTSPDNGDTYRISVAGTLPVVGYAEVGDLLVYDLPTTTWTLFQTNMTIGDLLGNVQENGANLNATEIVETNALKKFITAVKNTAYNKNFGVSGLGNNVPAIGGSGLAIASAPVVTDASQKIITVVKGSAFNKNFGTSGLANEVPEIGGVGIQLINSPVVTDASQKLISEAKGSAFNKNFGVSGLGNNVPAIGGSGLAIASAPVVTDASQKIITVVKGSAFNKDLGFTSANVPRGDLVQQLSQKDAANGYPGLDAAGLLNPAQLPPLAITDTFVVASEVAQLALTVQQGDVAVRSDENKSYINVTGNNVSMADWQLLLTPTDAVLSVFSRTGVVTAQNGDYTAGQLTNVPAGTVAAMTVQAAIDELDTEKATPADITADIGTHTAIAGAHHARPIQATESVVGIAEVATQAETDAGTDDTRMITPKKLAAFPLPVFGTEFASAESTPESTYTGTTTPQTKTSITKTAPPSGNYHIEWSCQLSEDDENKQAIVDLYDGASVLDECKFTPKKKWGDANESYPKFGGSLVVALSATTTFSLRYATNDAGKTVAIKNARMQIWRVS